MASMDEQIATSGKDIFMLQSDKEALDFWNEPARAKIVVMYMQGCGWCHKFIPEFIKIAPTKANSDLLCGSASRAHVDKVAKFIPALQVQGFPTTVLVDQSNAVRHVIPGFMTPHALVDAIEAKFPELRGLPTLQYLQTVKRESLAQEQQQQPKTDALSNRALLPSRAAAGANANTTDATNTAGASDAAKTAGDSAGKAIGTEIAPPAAGGGSVPSNTAVIALATPPAAPLRATGASIAPGVMIPPGVTAGSGTAGDHALPPYLRTQSPSAGPSPNVQTPPSTAPPPPRRSRVIPLRVPIPSRAPPAVPSGPSSGALASASRPGPSSNALPPTSTAAPLIATAPPGAAGTDASAVAADRAGGGGGGGGGRRHRSRRHHHHQHRGGGGGGKEQQPPDSRRDKSNSWCVIL
jgi:hypothetical protein